MVGFDTGLLRAGLQSHVESSPYDTLADVTKFYGDKGGIIGLLGNPAVGIGMQVISKIASMIGQRKAEEEAERQRKKQEALQRAMWLSQRRERAAGEWF